MMVPCDAKYLCCAVDIVTYLDVFDCVITLHGNVIGMSFCLVYMLRVGDTLRLSDTIVFYNTCACFFFFNFQYRDFLCTTRAGNLLYPLQFLHLKSSE